MAISAIQTLKELKVGNSLSIWFLEDAPSYKAYIDFQGKFGSDEIFIAKQIERVCHRYGQCIKDENLKNIEVDQL